jgi:hypothetical protein
MMERIAAAFLATLVGIGMGGTAATAAQIEITYELQTTYTLVGVGELGPPSLGSMTVAFPAAGSAPASSTTEPGGTFGGAVIPHGPVHMSLLTFPPIIVNVTIAGDLISGVLNPTATTLASLPGSLMSNGALTLGPINIWDAGNLHCAGATCTALGFFSQSVPQMFTIGQAALHLSFPNVGTVGSGILNTMFSGSATIGSLFGYNVNAATVGQEVGRHFSTPEPHAVWLLGVGFVALSLKGWRRIRA